LRVSGTYQVSMGVRGHLVIPEELTARAGLTEGTRLILLETPRGIVMMSHEQLQARVRGELTGLDLLSELLADRHRAAMAEDASS
jgi:bifunctional DNA-binding transcriptional regulator/antitoxin component of YhaV-PrlF toxin-antitoxin module